MQGQGLLIRPYRSQDCTALIEVFRQSVRRIGIRDYSPEQVRAWAPDLIDAVHFGRRRSNQPTWVAEIDSQVIGFSDLEPQGEQGHIDMLYVHPDFERKGVAHALFRIVEREAQAKKFLRLSTEASIGARPVFERFGFQVVTPQTVSTGGQTFVNYRMEKVLAISPSPCAIDP